MSVFRICLSKEGHSLFMEFICGCRMVHLAHICYPIQNLQNTWNGRIKKRIEFDIEFSKCLKSPGNSIICSSCILETGKCWQAYCSPIGWYFVSINYQPIEEYMRVGLVWLCTRNYSIDRPLLSHTCVWLSIHPLRPALIPVLIACSPINKQTIS